MDFPGRLLLAATSLLLFMEFGDAYPSKSVGYSFLTDQRNGFLEERGSLMKIMNQSTRFTCLDDTFDFKAMSHYTSENLARNELIAILSMNGMVNGENTPHNDRARVHSPIIGAAEPKKPAKKKARTVKPGIPAKLTLEHVSEIEPRE